MKNSNSGFKKFIGWLTVLVFGLSISASFVIAGLQLFAITAVGKGRYTGIFLGYIIEKFPLNTSIYFIAYAILGAILLARFHKWQFPDDSQQQPRGNRYI